MEPHRRWLLVFVTVLNPGLLIVDHIHFQYNGFLLGLLLLAIAEVHRGNDLLAGIWFAILLNFKHIFVYLAPTFFLYLLLHHCFSERPPAKSLLSSFRTRNFLPLGTSVVAIFALSFGPFATQIPQVLSRLFPFKRGLCHAYWAANFWALYTFADRILYYGELSCLLPTPPGPRHHFPRHLQS